jgi:hypothetical protein
MFEKNAAIQAYSAAFGNNLKRLEAYCREVGYAGDVTAFAASIQQLQAEIFDEIWRLSEQRKLSQDEMVAVARQYVSEHEPGIDETGLNGLMQWVAWMSWREGCIEIPAQHKQPKRWWQFW